MVLFFITKKTVEFLRQYIDSVA